MEYIVASQSDFERNFDGNNAFPTIECLQVELNRLVDNFNDTLCTYGLCIKTQIRHDIIAWHVQKLRKP